MSIKKEKLLEKLLKKDYNNNLEEILARKNFDEEVKNLLLDMLYKIEMSYKDYETVKKNVLTKDAYIENIIKSIKNNCDYIEFVRMDEEDEEETETFMVNREKKQITCYPMTQKLLYAIAKIQKSDDIIKQEPDFLNKALTNTINIGNNINMVEPLRDFNGFAWSIAVSEIENFYYNLIYQDLIILTGNKLLEEWTNKHDNMIDYLELFKDNLENDYGIKFQNEILELLKNLSILLELTVNEPFKEELKTRKEEVESELSDMQNRESYIENLTKHKKKITKQIREIDIILNDQEKLAKEYIKRNKDLPLEEKIFSKRVLQIKLVEERQVLLDELKVTSEKMNSKTFMQRRQNFEYELQYLKLVDIENLEKEILEKIILLQKRVLQALKIKIRHTMTREDLNKILYEIRYLKLIPISNIQTVGKVSKLSNMFMTLESHAIDRAYELRDFNEICKYRELDLNILKNVFDMDIIKLEDISLKLLKEKDGKYVQFYDDGIIDEKFKLDCELEKEDLRIKFNKKIKLFDL